MFIAFCAALGLSILALIFAAPSLFRTLIRRRLGGYQRVHTQADISRHEQASTPRSVAVVGAGVAGISAALTLARRGHRITLFERNAYLGGKLGSWTLQLGQQLGPERSVRVSHGFHAFFAHYYNLNRLLDSLGLRRDFLRIDDYVILGRDGREQRFAELPRTPVLNLLGMWRAGAFSLLDALRAPGRDCYGVFLEYEESRTFSELDRLSYRDFAERARVPRRLQLAFGTFARAFFASEDRLSMAELVKAFHFYYLSHDGGLLYDFPADDYEPALWEPMRRELERLGVEIVLGHETRDLARHSTGFSVDGRNFERLILATDAKATRQLMQSAQGFDVATTQPLSSLKSGERYAVLRIWTDKDLRPDLPVFVITEKARVLDSVTAFHRFERSAQRDVQTHGGAVLELHSYAVPDDLADDQVHAALLSELVDFFPELIGLTVHAESFQLRDDFTAFHVGLHDGRPAVRTTTPGFVCAGDWVRLPFPAMLLEAACASGLLAASALLEEDGLSPEPVYSVPLRGLMAGVPAPPRRKRWLFPEQR